MALSDEALIALARAKVEVADAEKMTPFDGLFFGRHCRAASRRPWQAPSTRYYFPTIQAEGALHGLLAQDGAADSETATERVGNFGAAAWVRRGGGFTVAIENTNRVKYEASGGNQSGNNGEYDAAKQIWGGADAIKHASKPLYPDLGSGTNYAMLSHVVTGSIVTDEGTRIERTNEVKSTWWWRVTKSSPSPDGVERLCLRVTYKTGATIEDTITLGDIDPAETDGENPKSPWFLGSEHSLPKIPEEEGGGLNEIISVSATFL